MSCPDCTPSLPSQVYAYQFTYNPNCSTSQSCTAQVSSKCSSYLGANLVCSGINSGDTIETAIQKLDTAACQAVGDYSTYNVHCLSDGGAITTQAEFVDVASNMLCTLNTSVGTFLDTTFPAYQTAVTAQIAAALIPAMTCTTASVTSTDNVNSVLSKYCTKFGAIDAALDLSSVVWNSCFTVSSNPTSIAAGFNLLINQICQIENGGSGDVLPTFNNTGSCLSTTGATDTLVNTVNAIRSRLCTTPVFDINALTWGCISKPSSSTTDLQSAFQSVLTKIDTLTENGSTFSSDFVVTNVDNATPCLGKHIALATPLNLDRYVASNSSDTSPGTLADKLQEGANVTIDSTTTEGKIIISASGGSSDGLVYGNLTDDTKGYLDDKLEGFVGDSITISTSYDAINKKVKVAAYIDESALAASLMTLIASDTTLYAQFCALGAGCPSPCQPPQNAQAIIVTTTTTTTL